MKRLSVFFISICLAVLSSLTTSAQERAGSDAAQPAGTDSIVVSLLTCSPGNEVWSLYGHTAIRFQMPARGLDLAVNYGMFNFGQKNFVLRFVFGLTDYEMGIEPFAVFLSEYARHGRGVVEQRLNLTAREARDIAAALERNYEPANRVYRYNYFYDNCTTRARDILTGHLEGTVTFAADSSSTPSYRQLVHQWNEAHRWSRFGNDLLLGIKADAPTTRRQQQFLPDTLRHDFARAVIVSPEGTRRQLVDTTLTLLTACPADGQATADLWDSVSPRLLFGILALVVALVSLLELKRGKPFWPADALLLAATGLAGLVLTAMIFSQHPTVNANLQILLLNPLSVIFAYPAVRQQVKHRCHWYWKMLLACLGVFVAGNIWQDYAEGMNILALCLMLRCCINIKTLTPKRQRAA